MLVGIQGRLSHPGGHLAETGLAGKVRAQHQRIGEEPNQIFQFAALPVRDRGSDQNVVLSAIPGQQDLEGGQQTHEGS